MHFNPPVFLLPYGLILTAKIIHRPLNQRKTKTGTDIKILPQYIIAKHDISDTFIKCRLMTTLSVKLKNMKVFRSV